VIELGEDLALDPEPLLHLLDAQTRLDQLDGHLAVVLLVGAGGAVDIGHAAVADGFVEFVGAEAQAGEGSPGRVIVGASGQVRDEIRGQGTGGTGQNGGVVRIVCGEQSLHFTAQVGAVGAGFVQKGRTSGVRLLEGCGEEIGDSLPGISVHDRDKKRAIGVGSHR